MTKQNEEKLDFVAATTLELKAFPAGKQTPGLSHKRDWHRRLMPIIVCLWPLSLSVYLLTGKHGTVLQPKVDTFGSQ